MIDFHTHILPGIDDGPNSLDESVEMAYMAAEDGTQIIVATPHAPGFRGAMPQLLHSRLAELQAAVAEEGIHITIVPGNELFYNADLVSALRKKQVLSCNGTRTVLIETYIAEPFPHDFRQAIYELQIAGYRVVLAHPERVTDVQDDPNILIPLIERGVLMQLTAQALTGDQGKRMQELAETLVRHHLVHLIASDAHGASYRPPLLSEAYAKAVNLVGQKMALAMVYDVPKALLSDQYPAIPEPRPVKDHHKRIFWW